MKKQIYAIAYNRSICLAENMVFQIIDSYKYKPNMKITKKSLESIQYKYFIISKENIDFYEVNGILGYLKNIPIYPSICEFKYYSNYKYNDSIYTTLSTKQSSKSTCELCNQKCNIGTKMKITDNEKILIYLGYSDSEIKSIKGKLFSLTQNMIDNINSNKDVVFYIDGIPIDKEIIEIDFDKNRALNYHEEDLIFQSLSYIKSEYDKLNEKYIISYSRSEETPSQNKVVKTIKRKVSIDKETYKKYEDIIKNEIPGKYIYKMVNNGIILVPKKFTVITDAKDNCYFKCKDNDDYVIFNINNMEHKGFKLSDDVFWSDNKVTFLQRYKQYLESEISKCDKLISFQDDVRKNKIKFIEITKQYLSLDKLWRQL